MMKILEKNDGDIFKSFIDVFEYIVSGRIDKIEIKIMKNVFLASNCLAQEFVIPRIKLEEIQENTKNVVKKIDTKEIKLKGENDLILLMEILVDVLIRNIICFFNLKMSKELAKENFRKKVNIIKRGACK